MTSKRYPAYVGVWKLRATDDSSKWFAMNADLDALRANAAAGHLPDDDADRPDASKAQQPDAAAGNSSQEDIERTGISNKKSQDPDGALRATINRIIDSNHSQAELLFLSAALVEGLPVFLTVRDVVTLIEKKGEVVDVVDQTTIYGVSADEIRRIRSSLDRMRRLEIGMKTLPAALFLSIVANFDSTVADIVRDMLNIKSETLQTGDRTILLSEALRADSIADLRERSITDEIYQFSRGSHEDQVQYIERNFHISIREHWKRWPDFIEVFERRNLVAHGEKAFTKRYSSVCTRHGHKGSEKLLGLPVELTSNYLQQAANLLLEFSLLLTFSLWRKQFPSEEQKAFVTLNEAAFKLIEGKNYEVAIRILDFALNLKNIKVEDRIRKMMYVNLASAHRHSGNEEQSLRILNSVDWSGSSDDFKVCVAALRGDVGEVTRLMPLVANSGAIGKDRFRGWPVFDFIHDSPEFLSKFAETFREPFREETGPERIELGSGAAIDDSRSITVH